MLEKRFLVIKKSGLFIEIPGLPSIRTPTELDITEVDVNIVLTSLKKYGLTDFKIVSKVIKKKKPIKKKEKSARTDLKPIYERFDRLEELLKTVLKRPIEKKIIVRATKTTSSSIPKIEELDERDDFIPMIDLSDLKESGESISKVSSDESTDVSENVEALKNSKKSTYKRGGS